MFYNIYLYKVVCHINKIQEFGPTTRSGPRAVSELPNKKQQKNLTLHGEVYK